MPILNIEGRKVKVDDSFLSLSPADQQSTVEEIASQLGISSQQQSNQPPQVSGMFDQFKAGLESNTELPGQTLEQLGTDLKMPSLAGTGTYLRNMTDQPDNFVSASDRFSNPAPGDSYVDPIAGYGWGNAPGMLAEFGGQMVGDIASRVVGSGVGAGVGAAAGLVGGGPAGAVGGAATGSVVGAFAGPALLEVLRVAGPLVRQRMAYDGRTEANWEDWTWAAGVAGVSGALNAIGIKNVGVLNNAIKDVGTKTATGVAKDAGTEIIKKAGTEGATEFGQSVVQQTGETADTKKGLTIDLKQAGADAIGGFAAAGAIDATRNVRPIFNAVNDVRTVDKAARNDPFARDKAEITKDVNNLANRDVQGNRELQPAEVSSYVQDLRNQAVEAIKGQNLEGADKKALIDGLKTAKGLTEERLNEIAGRSDSPDEIRAIARKIQLVRSMTVQQQAHKGLRGWAATGITMSGAGLGGLIGGSIGGGYGAAAGAEIGRNWSRDIARRLRASQTQGSRINALVGAKQARRAQLLLDRYGPSDATKALNTLTEKAAANKAQSEAEAQAKKDFADTMAKIRQWQAMRDKARKAEEQARNNEEKAKARAERQKYDSAYREARLKSMALKAANSEARNQRLVQDLEHKKAMNALTVEMTQVKNDLLAKQALAKTEGLDRKRKFEIDNLRGKMDALSLEIARRQEALKRAEIATKRAQKMADMAPDSAKSTVSKIRDLGAKWEPQDTSGIADPASYQRRVDEANTYKKQAMEVAREDGVDEGLHDLIRDTIEKIDKAKDVNGKPSRAARIQVFEDALDAAASIQSNGRKIMERALYDLAYMTFTSVKDAPAASNKASTEAPIPF